MILMYKWSNFRTPRRLKATPFNDTDTCQFWFNGRMYTSNFGYKSILIMSYFDDVVYRKLHL